VLHAHYGTKCACDVLQCPVALAVAAQHYDSISTVQHHMPAGHTHPASAVRSGAVTGERYCHSAVSGTYPKVGHACEEALEGTLKLHQAQVLPNAHMSAGAIRHVGDALAPACTP
jgi:hypothetical protein